LRKACPRGGGSGKAWHMRNALTIDVEDYYHVTAFEKYIKKGEWDSLPSRVVDNTLRVLDMADEHSVKATFFVLGWVAERAPQLVRRIQERGHEIACHGYGHGLVYRLGAEGFRADVKRAKSILEDASGQAVTGYRAPSYSITGNSLWAIDILIEEGFSYDSSIFPITHDVYGIPGAERFPYVIKRPTGSILEFPLSTREFSIWGRAFRLPVAGGGYLRLFPLWVIKKAIAHINESEKQPAVLYFHPWEMDPGQPRIDAGLLSSFRHYTNIDKTMEKTASLLSAFRFAPMRSVLSGLGLGNSALN